LLPRRGLALLALAALGLAGCGLQPVYSGGTTSVSSKLLTQISVAPIPDRAGFLVRQDLLSRFGDTVADPRYRLEVELDDQIIAFGVRGDNSSARERRILRARYRLVIIATNTIVVDATAASDAGIDRVSSNYAVVAAETTALERLAVDISSQITARMAQYARTLPAAP
jgi:LPS-assembly lipoprotein